MRKICSYRALEAAPPLASNENVSSRGIEGLLIAPQPTSHYQLDLKWERVSAVSLSETLTSPRIHTF